MKKIVSKFSRKVNLSFVLLLLFIGLTIWLSYILKKQYATNEKLKSSIEQNRHDEFLLHNRINHLNDAFMENIKMKGEKLSGSAVYSIAQKLLDADIVTVLYLRAYSCEDCYSSIITRIIDRLSGKAGFHIISHSSNRHYIEEMHKLNVIKDLSIVLWDDDELYSTSFPQTTAELVLIDNQQRVKAMLPLDFFSDHHLFLNYVTWIESGLKLEKYTKRTILHKKNSAVQ
jgi:hypothetical protein